ncbi:MAG: hypothetical protein ACR2P9_01060 [Gammaproteobacteria bacterium]
MRSLFAVTVLVLLLIPIQAIACPAVCNCKGYDGIGGVCYDGVGGPCYDAVSIA